MTLGNCYDKKEGYLVVVSLSTLGSLIIVTLEVSLVGLSLVLSVEYTLESPNPGAVMSGTLLGATPGLWFVSESLRYWYSCCCLTDFRGGTCGEGERLLFSRVPHYKYLFIYNMNSVLYFQLVELLTLSIATTWLIPSSEGR